MCNIKQKNAVNLKTESSTLIYINTAVYEEPRFQDGAFKMKNSAKTAKDLQPLTIFDKKLCLRRLTGLLIYSLK